MRKGARGFDASVLSEVRARLIDGGRELLLLDTLLERLRERGLRRARGRARTDSTHVLAAVRLLSRLLNCGATVRAALNALAEADPDWLAPHIGPGLVGAVWLSLDRVPYTQE